MLVNYPVQFPQEALLTILDKVRGKPVSLAELLHAGWNVQGYAQAQTVGGGNAIGAVDASSVTLESAIVDILDAHEAELNGAKSFPLIGWPVILKLVISLLVSAVMETE